MSARPVVPIPDRARALLQGGLRIGTIATVRPDSHLSVVPVGLVLVDDELKFSTQTDRGKVRNLAADPRITVCVVDPQNPSRYVEIRGRAEVADDIDRAFIDWVARTYMGRDEYPYESRDIARSVITVRPERITMPKVQGSD